VGRRRQRRLIVAIAAATAGLWALPGIVRRVAVDQMPKLTGRAASIADVDLNLFTGSFGVKGFRLAEREGWEPLLELERIEGRLSLPWLVRLDIRLRNLNVRPWRLHAVSLVLGDPRSAGRRGEPGRVRKVVMPEGAHGRPGRLHS
jgi:hypothetical protein